MDNNGIKPIGVVKAKKSKLNAFADKINDNISKSNIKERVIDEIALPMLLDMITTSIAGVFGIENYKARRSIDGVISTVRANGYHKASNYSGSYVTYGSGSTYDVKSDIPTRPARRSVYDYDNAIFSTQKDAMAKYEELKDKLLNEEGKCIKVADMVELAGGNPSHVDYNYGWKTLDGVTFDHIRTVSDNGERVEGWIIKLPRPVPLD